ncbi:hypothetical protein P4E94_04800 [Pontiellaceae bacterium B12219]|nr:hypothetical protein [Pontiellaceae bacterium B12219]
MMRFISVGLSLLLSVSALAQVDGDPLYTNISVSNETFYAWRPFYSSSTEPERWRKDYLWPLYTKKGFKEEQYSRFLFFGYSSDFSPDTDRERNWLVPFYFQGTSAAGEDYLAVFPFGGTIYEFLGRDKVTFVLFPFYGTSDINEVHTITVFWPFGSKAVGDKVYRFRVFPFYANNTLEGEFVKKYYMWPFYSTVDYIHERNPGGGFILFPIYGKINTERADNYWVIPPFFRYMTSDDQWIVHAPWPFIQLADGMMDKRIFWPFYGKKSMAALTKQYMIWPFFWNNTSRYATYDQSRKKIIPFVYTQKNVVTQETKEHAVGDVLSNYWKIWPLMSWDRVDDKSRFRTLELWPMRNTPGIERNWAAWWTLYTRTHVEDETGHNVLWGVYRQKKSLGHFEWSLLKGVAGYKKTGNNRRYRILFMWVGDEEEQP